MPRPRNARPSRKLHTSLPAQLGDKLDLYLYSAAEQRVPFAAHQRFVIERTQEFFDRSTLDIAPYLGLAGGSAVVYGSAEAIELLKRHLSK